MYTGLRVCHAKYGAGTLRMRLGRDMLVNFDKMKGPALRVPLHELTVPNANAATSQPLTLAGARPLQAPVSLAPEAGVNRGEDVRLLEALRLGVVPPGHAETYTVGRGGLFTSLRADLDWMRQSQQGAFRVVLGDYGTGKTHLLSWLRETALAQNFLVATATLGSGEASPAYPKRLYNALMQSITYPDIDDERPGLRPLFEKLAQRRPVPRSPTAPGYHMYLDAVAFYFTKLWRGADDDSNSAILHALLDWIEGNPADHSVDWNATLRRQVSGAPYLYALADYRNFAHVYAYILGGLSALAVEAGYSGLVLLFDEAEMYNVMRTDLQDFADNVFKCYALASLGGGGVKFAPDSIRVGGMAAHRAIPVRYTGKQPLMCTFCLTPSEKGRAALGRCVDLTNHEHQLGELTRADYAELVQRVANLFDCVHPGVRPSAGHLQRLAAMLDHGVQTGQIHNPRAAIRVLVDMLDVARLVPESLEKFMQQLEAVC